MMTPLRAAILSPPPFSPAQLFAAGEQGAWFDPSDLSAMFQDTAGATPVTATGQSVALILDKSGRGNHASQATAGSRPLLQQDTSGRFYLSFDGVNDSLATSAITSGVDKAQIIAGVRKLTDAAFGVIAGLNNSLTGACEIGAAGSALANYVSGLDGSLGAENYASSTFTAPHTAVLSTAFDIAGSAIANEIFPRVNGAVATLTAGGVAAAGTGNFSALPITVGMRSTGTFPFNGNIYGLIVRFSGANLDAATIGALETWMNRRTGAY